MSILSLIYLSDIWKPPPLKPSPSPGFQLRGGHLRHLQALRELLARPAHGRRELHLAQLRDVAHAAAAILAWDGRDGLGEKWCLDVLS